MAGIWDRVIPGGENADRVNVHLLKAAIYCAVRGVFSNAQILAKLNAQITVPLDSAAEADLAAGVINADTGTAIQKIDYLERWDALNIAAENGLLTDEATYRSELGI